MKIKFRSFLKKPVMYLYNHLFKQVFRRIILEELDYESTTIFATKVAIQRAFHYISVNKVNGNYFEFGLYEGRSFLFALDECKKRNKRKAKNPDSFKMHCHGFDSFSGLPEIIGNKDVFKDSFGKDKWSQGDYSCGYLDFEKILKKNNVLKDLYTLHEGFYSESLTNDLQKKVGRAAVVHIDCDLYLSTKDVLFFLKPLLQQGTVVIFDDFYHYKGDPKKGEKGALREFLAANQKIEFIDYYNHSYSGKSFIVNIKNN